MPPKKHQRLSKKDYIEQKIDVVLAEIYQNEVARDFNLLIDEKDRTNEQQKSIHAANHNIAQLSKSLEWLEACLERV